MAELGSFSAVAQQLGVARSVVTRQVAALEAHLGTELMARSTCRLWLTSAGTAYLEKCRVILNLVDAAETGVAEERAVARGNIRIGLPLSFGLRRLAPLLLEALAHGRDAGLAIPGCGATLSAFVESGDERLVLGGEIRERAIE